MVYRKLNGDTVDIYLAYLRRAMREEPDEMMCRIIDEDAIRQRMEDPFFSNTISILAVEDGEAVGRLEYHFYGCIQDGCKMAYVDWVYVLSQYRHRGIAQGLFKEFEKECIKHGIDQYYLIRSEENEADRFYRSFCDAELSKEPVLRKYLSAE